MASRDRLAGVAGVAGVFGSDGPAHMHPRTYARATRTCETDLLEPPQTPATPAERGTPWSPPHLGVSDMSPIVTIDPDTLFDPQTPMAEALRQTVAGLHSIPAAEV